MPGPSSTASVGAAVGPELTSMPPAYGAPSRVGVPRSLTQPEPHHLALPGVGVNTPVVTDHVNQEHAPTRAVLWTCLPRLRRLVAAVGDGHAQPPAAVALHLHAD